MSYNPNSIAALRRYASASGAPVAYLATALTEDPTLDPAAIGDSGHSVGLFQENDRGRGYGLSVQQRSDPFANAQRGAKEFRQYYDKGLRGAQLALAAQRPSDPTYASKFKSNWAKAQQLWAEMSGGGAPSARTTGAPASARTPANPGVSLLALAGPALASRGQNESLTSALGRAYLSQELAGGGPQQATPRAPKVPRTPGAPLMGTGVLGSTYKVIGTPYSGTHTLGNWESDNAVDLATPVGTPVYALEDGVIGPQFGALNSSNPRMAGLRLHLNGADNNFYYAHLSKFANGIQPGARVRKGQLLGYSGAANGVAHLHLGVERGDPRRYH